MFPREQRLHSSKNILYVFRRGERRTYGLVSCTFVPKPGSLGKVAVIADTKVSRKAVQRNQVRRRIQAALQEKHLPEGMLVVRLLPGASELPYQTLTEHLTQCLQRLLRSN